MNSNIPNNPKVRIAPSPTGSMHIGTVRTALYNWLVAKKYKGEMFIRIEDTDANRNVDDEIKNIINDYKWLGLDYSSEITFQSNNKDKHLDAIKLLLDNNLAYWDNASSDEVQEFKKANKGLGWRGKNGIKTNSSVVRLDINKVLDNSLLSFNDLVAGKLSVDMKTIDDIVLARKDGSPLFLLANAVDDLDMNIIIRGNDHVTNTFKQITILKALDKAIPIYAHLPLLHGPDGAKLSKRHKNKDGSPMAITIDELRNKGYLPEAIISYISKLGWGQDNDEVLTINDLIKNFELTEVKNSSARFDEDKLRWINGRFMRDLDIKSYTKYLSFYLNDLNDDISHLVQDKAQTMIEARDLAYFVNNRPTSYDTKADKFLNDEGLKALDLSYDKLKDINWTLDDIDNNLRNLANDNDIKLKNLLQPIRVALSGSLVGPSLFHSLEILGKDESLIRIKLLIDFKNNNQSEY